MVIIYSTNWLLSTYCHTNENLLNQETTKKPVSISPIVSRLFFFLLLFCFELNWTFLRVQCPFFSFLFLSMPETLYKYQLVPRDVMETLISSDSVGERHPTVIVQQGKSATSLLLLFFVFNFTREVGTLNKHSLLMVVYCIPPFGIRMQVCLCVFVSVWLICVCFPAAWYQILVDFWCAALVYII